MLRLGTFTASSPFLLAPMESVSDSAWRRLCFAQGAGFTWTEMIRAKGLARNNKATFDLIDTFDADVPTGVQLLVANERELGEALARLDAGAAGSHPHFQNLRAVDLNFGCPSPEVIRAGAGPALLKRKAKLEVIFQTLRAWQRQTKLPIAFVGAKIRLGLNRPEQDQQVYLPIMKLANEHLDYLVVHARHARQESQEPPTWSALAELKRVATVPLIGNGDVTSRAEWERLVKETGCDGALIARAAIKSPWVFRELRGEGPALPSSDELSAASGAYFELARARGTKQKFLDWHEEGFRRIRARLEGRAVSTALPANEHMR